MNTKLKNTRRQKGLTQAEVAKRAGITVTGYSRYENGQRTPRVDVAKRIANALGSTVDELF